MNKKRIKSICLPVILAASMTALSLSSCGNKLSGSTEKAETRLQDDFYQSVNSEILKNTKPADGYESWDNFTLLDDKVHQDLKNLTDEVRKDKEKYGEDSAERTIAQLYDMALDKEGREKAGLGPLVPYIEELKSAQSVSDYLKAAARIRKELGKSSLLTFGPYPNPENSSVHALFMDEPVLPVKKEDMESPDTVENLQKYIAQILTAADLNQKESEDWSQKIMDLYKELSNAALSQTDRRNVERTTNRMALEEIQAKMPDINLAGFLADSGQDGYTDHFVINPAMLSVINKYLNPDYLELIKHYAIVSLLHEYAPYLNENISQASAEFNQEDTDESKLAWEAVNKLADMELGELYSRKYFSPEKKQDAEKLISSILSAYKKNIQQLDWLSEENKKEAVKKIDTMKIKAGYPDSYVSWLKGNVKSAEQGGSLIENAVSADKRKAEAEQKKVAEPVNREEWGLSPKTLNAYYEPSANEIVFPAAILQAPFYEEKASLAKNLGGIGAIIAHEITHAFDDTGSLYDEKGNYRDWWTAKDRETFAEKSKQFVEYFGSYEVIPGHKLDGELTLAENIADAGSISAISSMLENDKESLKEMFRSYAAVWAGKAEEEEIKNQLMSDDHAPGKARVNRVLSTTDAFYKAFDIKPGDGMYVPEEKRVKMY